MKPDLLTYVFTLPCKKRGVIATDGADTRDIILVNKALPEPWTIIEAHLIEVGKKTAKAAWTNPKLAIEGDLPDKARQHMLLGAWADRGSDFKERALSGWFARGLDHARRERAKVGHEYTPLKFTWDDEVVWGFEWERDLVSGKDNFKDIIMAYGERSVGRWWLPEVK